jgi:hypothetical protein
MASRRGTSLVAYRIWDNHFHGFLSAKNPIEQYEQNNFFVERMGIERTISQEIGGTLEEPFALINMTRKFSKILERDKDRLSGRTPIDPGFPDESCAKIEKWIRNGPCIGIKYPGTGKTAVTCSHPITIRSCGSPRNWMSTSISTPGSRWAGAPRWPGGDNLPSESTPMDVAKLAQRFPQVAIICGHTGGDWELGVRAVRPYKNVLMEFAGSDPHSGMVDYAMRELGAGPAGLGRARSQPQLCHELGKVLDADFPKPSA